MFKNAIYPIQAWLLSQGRCVGCGRSLADAKRSSAKGKQKATCECGRIFIYDPKTGKYRRALLSEA